MVTHDVALWNGNDTSLSSPTTTQYMGAIAQIVAGGNTTTIGTSASIVDGIKSAVAQMVASNGYHVRPTAIYANPVLLDLIDREMKTEFNVVLNTDQITGGFRVKMLSTQAGDLPLIPDWSLSYTGTPGSGSAVLPAYIVTEDLIEYHWLGDPHPAHLPARHARLAGPAVCRGQVRRRRGQGRQLRPLPGAGRSLNDSSGQ